MRWLCGNEHSSFINLHSVESFEIVDKKMDNGEILGFEIICTFNSGREIIVYKTEDLEEANSFVEDALGQINYVC